jgi:DNA replication protein DnaC
MIPPKFRGLTLDSLQPELAKHRKQVEVVPFIKANPERSYFLSGSTGTGKSTFMWALYRHAIEGPNRAIICTLSELLDEYRSHIGGGKLPRLCAWQLTEGVKYSLFLDDVDKANPTDYAAEQIFLLANAIYEHRHQLVVTTNKTIAGLVDFYNRSDDRGSAIVRRMIDGAKIIEMF